MRSPTDDVPVDAGRPPSPQFPAKIALKNGSKEPTLQATIPAGKPTNYSTPERTIWSADAKGWFSCGYGPFRRVFGASPEAMRQMTAHHRAVCDHVSGGCLLAETDQWLRNLKYKELENKAAERDQLALLMEILREDLMPNQITIDRVDSDGLWLKDRNGVQLAWGEMSHGYRAALGLLTDILRHLINTYGTADLTERGPDGKLRIKRSGVVLIDEIDAHLHPEWQRQVGFWLKQHFPNIQFLVTTHSPIICQAADTNGLFVLPEPASGDPPRPLTQEDYRKVIASRPDTILLTRPSVCKTHARRGQLQHAQSTPSSRLKSAQAPGSLRKKKPG